MKPIDYNCKLCGKGGVAYYDPRCPIRDIEAWRSCICCDRCYQFRDAYSKAKRSIERICINLISSHQIKDNEVRKAIVAKIRERLTEITKRMAGLCSDYYRVQNFWDVEIVDILMDSPAGCNRAINVFRDGYAKQAETPRQEAFVEELV